MANEGTPKNLTDILKEEKDPLSDPKKEWLLTKELIKTLVYSGIVQLIIGKYKYFVENPLPRDPSEIDVNNDPRFKISAVMGRRDSFKVSEEDPETETLLYVPTGHRVSLGAYQNNTTDKLPFAKVILEYNVTTKEYIIYEKPPPDRFFVPQNSLPDAIRESLNYRSPIQRKELLYIKEDFIQAECYEPGVVQLHAGHALNSRPFIPESHYIITDSLIITDATRNRQEGDKVLDELFRLHPPLSGSPAFFK